MAFQPIKMSAEKSHIYQCLSLLRNKKVGVRLTSGLKIIGTLIEIGDYLEVELHDVIIDGDPLCKLKFLVITRKCIDYIQQVEPMIFQQIKMSAEKSHIYQRLSQLRNKKVKVRLTRGREIIGKLIEVGDELEVELHDVIFLYDHPLCEVKFTVITRDCIEYIQQVEPMAFQKIKMSAEKGHIYRCLSLLRNKKVKVRLTRGREIIGKLIEVGDDLEVELHDVIFLYDHPLCEVKFTVITRDCIEYIQQVDN